MFIKNPTGTASIKGFNYRTNLMNVGCGEVVEVNEEMGKALLQTFGFLLEVKSAESSKVKSVSVPEPETEVLKQEQSDLETGEELPTNFMQLKAYAKSKGMDVTKETKKEEIIKALQALSKQIFIS